MKKLLPMKVGDYEADGKDHFYDEKTTYHYMDGAAELYRSYGFKSLMVRRYLKANSPALVVELFDMGSSEDAFGIFSYETGDEEVGIGQGSDYGGGLLRFWKDRYFVNVYAEKVTPSTREDVLKTGNEIAKMIKQEGKKPKLLQFLPKENLVERDIRYFHLHQILNHHYFISLENILHLDRQTDAVIAPYETQTKGKYLLLLIQYPSVKHAEKGYRSFLKAYMTESISSGILKTENGKWTAAKLFERYIIAVFDLPQMEETEKLIEATRKKLEGK